MWPYMPFLIHVVTSVIFLLIPTHPSHFSPCISFSNPFSISQHIPLSFHSYHFPSFFLCSSLSQFFIPILPVPAPLHISPFLPIPTYIHHFFPFHPSFSPHPSLSSQQIWHLWPPYQKLLGLHRMSSSSNDVHINTVCWSNCTY